MAEAKAKQAEAAIASLRDVVAEGRNSEATSENPQLVMAEEAANRARYQLDQAQANIAEIQADVKVSLAEYYSSCMLIRANLYKSLHAYKSLFLGPLFFI